MSDPKFFWTAEPTIAEPRITVHRIVKITDDFTPADSECEEYHAECGTTGLGWYSPCMGVPETKLATDINSKPVDAILCPICFPPE